jgi:glycosyltransferase involved in cell wall biosynthesis
MKIVFLLKSYNEQCFGGAELQAYLLASEAKQKEFEVHYIFVSTGKSFTKKLDIHLHPIREKKWARKLGRNGSFVYYFAIMRKLREINPDFIYQRVAIAFTGIAANYAKKNTCKMIWHIANEPDVKPLHVRKRLKSVCEYIDKRFVEYGIRHANYIIGQADYQEELLLKNYNKKCDLIIGNWHKLPKDECNRILPVKIIWVANLKQKKRPEKFVELAKMFKNRHDIKFIMIGREGNRHTEFKKSIIELNNLEYLGEQPNEKVNLILSESHIFINTSDYEGFPNTFIQAWMRGVPVISLTVDPDNVLVREGIGFHSKTFEQMIQDVCCLVDDVALREKMGKRAQIYANNNHSIKNNISKIFEMIGLSH